MDDLTLPNELAQVKEKMKTDPAAAAAMIQEYLEKENKIPLNIGITGETGSGKSTFVNAFRGISDSDEGAAPTDCVETTTEVTAYPHPNQPNVVLWDLPGVGTTKFPADKYLELVGFEKYDFFIIISNDRFKENDVKLALEIKKMGKKFYFVRSKIDNNLRAEERKKDFNRERTLARIRENCIQGLQNQGFQSPQVFLLSSFDLQLYDFPRLQETLERELPAHKKHALLLAMPNVNLEIINKKKQVFQENIKWYAAASAGVAAVPIPGISASVDLALMVIVANTYRDGFQLDDSSLRRLAAKTGVSLSDLESELKSPLAGAASLTINRLRSLLIEAGITVTEMAVEEGFRFVPFIGIPVAMVLSFITTYKILNYFLDSLADDAQRVFKRALGLNTSV